MSLAVPYRADSGRVGATKGTLVRLSIGFEAVEDLIADLESALAKLGLA